MNTRTSYPSHHHLTMRAELSQREDLLLASLLHIEPSSLVRGLARAPLGEVGEGTRGVSASPLLQLFGCREGLLAGGLGSLASDWVGDDVFVDDLYLAEVSGVVS